jgi:hypothetical protein
MSVRLEKFGEFAHWMKNVDPRKYEEFVRLLDAYVFEVTVAVTEVSSGDILQAQGRAQQARKFFQLLTEIREPKE